MPETPIPSPLEALLDSWDKNNTIMVSLLRALPEGGLEARATPGSPSIAELFMHVRFVRLCAVAENDLELAKNQPEIVLKDEDEWLIERDIGRMAQMLNDSAKVVRDAVENWLEADRSAIGDYAHPILLLQHMLWHEGYHVGQMKLALKLTGRAMTDQEAGPVTWGVWRRKN